MTAREEIRCTARCSGGRRPERAGTRCRNARTPGATVCPKHGGQAPAVRAKAKERVAEAQIATILLGSKYDPVPVRDPYSALLEIAGKVTAFVAVAEDQVRNLRSVATTSDLGVEHVRAAVAVFQRALVDAGRLLSEIAKLDLSERLVRLEELRADRFVTVLSGAAARLDWDVDAPAIHAAVLAELEALPAEAIMSS